MTPQELLTANGIYLRSYDLGNHTSICPKCSHMRSRAHQKTECVSVKIDDKGPTWHCHHCDYSGPPKGSGKSNGQGDEHFVAAYDYPGFQKVRYPKGHEPRFRIRHREGNGWKWGAGGADTNVLYRKDELGEAIALGRTILVVEGEKDVDCSWSIDIPATCNSQGASEPDKKPKWKPAHSEQLRGANIVVVPDHDAAGYAHANAACQCSLGVAKRVRRLDLAKHWLEIPKGGDVSDWLAAGHTGAELAALIEQAPDYAPTKQAEEGQAEEQEPSAADAEITRLARLAPLQYEQERKGAAERLDIRAAILDKLVAAERARLNPDDGSKQGHAIAFPDPEPWPDPVAGAVFLDDLATAIRKHVVLPDHARDACALWVVHTYLTNRFLISPRLGVRSPTKGCGKTLLLDVLDRVVARPLPTANVTAAAIFRVIEAHRPTLLVDEADTFLYDNDELRGVLNSGHRKGGAVLRTVGDDHEPRSFATYSACVIALIGALPDTLHDRAVTVDLKRRLPSEKVEPFRPDRADHLDVLARKAVRWANDHADRIGAADPAMPDCLVNRAADNWRPLLAIADVAGGEWPERARRAAEASRNAEGDDGSRLELLLADIRDAFADKAEMASVDLVKALVELEGRPWAELGKSRKPLTQNRLARMLKPISVTPEPIEVEGNLGERKQARGYKRERFEEAFIRYLPLEGDSNRHSVTDPIKTSTSDIFKPSRAQNDVTVAKSQKPNNDGLRDGVTVAKGGNGDARVSSPFDDGVGSGAKAQPRTAKSRSDDLPYRGPVVPCPDVGPDALDDHGAPVAAPAPTNGGIEPGLSQRRIRDLAEQYQELAYANAQETGGDTRTAQCDVWLRQTLAEDGVLPESVKVEFERVMTEVFRGV
jgi:uncharacterized protein DUF3631